MERLLAVTQPRSIAVKLQNNLRNNKHQLVQLLILFWLSLIFLLLRGCHSQLLSLVMVIN